MFWECHICDVPQEKEYFSKGFTSKYILYLNFGVKHFEKYSFSYRLRMLKITLLKDVIFQHMCFTIFLNNIQIVVINDTTFHFLLQFCILLFFFKRKKYIFLVYISLLFTLDLQKLFCFCEKLSRNNPGQCFEWLTICMPIKMLLRAVS